MIKLKSPAWLLLLLLALSGCASVPHAQQIPVAVQCPAKPAPPAWTMQAPSNSLQTLGRIISLSSVK